jgi:signal transduction histidine kinase
VPEQSSPLRADLEAVWAISAPEGAGAAVDAVLAFASTVLQEAALDPGGRLADEAPAVVACVSELARMTEAATRRTLFRHASRRLALVGRDPAATLDAELRLLVMLAPVAAASVWLPTTTGTLELAAASGPLAATRRCRCAAASALAHGPMPKPHNSRVRVHGFALGREGALVVRLALDAYADALPFLEEFALAFASIGERDRLARASASDDRRLQQAYERRLMRAAFDLHDGPLQDLAALAAEVRFLRSQIGEADELRRDLLVGRMDDVTGRIVELDQSLRGIMQSLETSTLAERPVPEALQREGDTFTRRTGVRVTVDACGDFGALTMSQRIAVVRIVQEALSNVRAHSNATHVDVVLRAGDEGLTLRVSDDGCGFDVGATAAAAARRGRLGLVGMNERVRLLGGVFSLDSTPGAGTTVSASIPAYRPLTV